MTNKTNNMTNKRNDITIISNNMTKERVNMKRVIKDFGHRLIGKLSAWILLLIGFTFEVEQKIRKGARVVRYKIIAGTFMIKQKLVCTKGLTTIEIILIIVVLVALILIFKDELGALINRIFDNIRSESGDVMSGY